MKEQDAAEQGRERHRAFWPAIGAEPAGIAFHNRAQSVRHAALAQRRQSEPTNHEPATEQSDTVERVRDCNAF